MSISNVSNRWLNRTYKCLAILLVLFALLISSLRLLLPYAHHYRQHLQDYINSQYNSHILIGSLHMEWAKYGPSLVAENVSLLQTEISEVFIQKIQIHLDFWQSIRSRQFITRDFTLAGAKVLFDQTVIGQDGRDSDEDLNQNMAELFLQQVGQFSLQNSQIIFKTQTQQRTFLISQLRWLNDGNRHQAKGKMIVDGLTSNNLQLMLDVQGSELNNMSGQLYLQANQLNITPWLDKILAIEDEKTHSNINFDAWLTIEQGSAEQLLVKLANNEINWQVNDELQTLTLNAGQIIAQDFTDFSQFSMFTSPLTISVNGNTWQPLNIEASKTATSSFAYVSSLDLTGLADIYPLLAKQPQTRSLIKGLSPRGTITDLYFQSLKNETQNSSIKASGSFANISTEFSGGIPGIDHLNGQFLVVDQVMELGFTAKQGALDFDKHFILPIPYNTVSGTVTANINERGWQFSSQDIKFSSDELALSAQIKVEQVKDSLVNMALLAFVSEGDTRYAHHYYPHLLMGNELVDYLNGALVKGKLAQAQVLFNGPIANFPFTDHSGVFVVDAELTDSTFQFDPHWPSIDDFNANLNFTNNSMLISGRSGHLLGLDVTGVTSAIADLAGEQILTVNAEINQTEPKLIAQLMQQSPLAKTVGATLKQLVVSKPISGNFSLNLPLNHTASAVAKGEINFTDNLVSLQTPRMDFSQVNGQLNFTNDVISVNGLSLNWLALPLHLNIAAKDNNDYYGTNINIEANWQNSQWQQYVPELLKKYGHGLLAWQGDLALNMLHDGGFSYDLSINSSLNELALDLPIPYEKSAEQQRTLSAQVSGQQHQSTINATYGEQLSFYGVLSHNDVSFSRAHLVLGNEKMLLPMDGFHITTQLEQAQFAQWQPLVIDIIDTVVSTEPVRTFTKAPLIAKPERIRGTVNKLEILGQTLNDVSFNLTDQQTWWQLHLNAKEARSQIKFHPNWYEQGIDIDADFIHLPNKEQTALTEHQPEISAASLMENNDVIFAHVPPMRLQCDSCRYGDVDLGSVSFNVNRTDSDVMKLQGFTAKRDKTKLAFEAQWQHNAQESTTSVEGTFASEDIGHEIEKLGFASSVKDSGIKTNFTLNWLGGPQNFSLPAVNADISATIDDGYLQDVSDQARIFSLLSLQSIVRKLTLDFRDIFSDGMFYSQIKGDFRAEKGILYTNNTRMKGAAGDLTIKGNVDLQQRLLDYRMSYKPNLTSSLPVLAWIATLNPVTFLAGVAIDQVITSQVVSEFNYELTGSVDDPILTQVNRKNKTVRVGRDTPPEIVENVPSTQESPMQHNNIDINPDQEKIQPSKSDG